MPHIVLSVSFPPAQASKVPSDPLFAGLLIRHEMSERVKRAMVPLTQLVRCLLKMHTGLSS